LTKKRATKPKKRNADQSAKQKGGWGGARAGAGAPCGPRGANKSTLEFRALCRQHDDASIERLVYLRDNSDNEWVVMAAIQILLDRGHGKPKQKISEPDDGPVPVEYHSYIEVKQALLEDGIDVDRLPALNDPRNTDRLTIEHKKDETEH
jgi:hypothetical protein